MSREPAYLRNKDVVLAFILVSYFSWSAFSHECSWYPKVQWGGPCLPSSEQWQNWNRLLSVSVLKPEWLLQKTEGKRLVGPEHHHIWLIRLKNSRKQRT